MNIVGGKRSTVSILRWVKYGNLVKRFVIDKFGESYSVLERIIRFWIFKCDGEDFIEISWSIISTVVDKWEFGIGKV